MMHKYYIPFNLQVIVYKVQNTFQMSELISIENPSLQVGYAQLIFIS